MKAVEAVIFVSLAGALHAAALGLTDLPGGGASGGDGGADSVTLAAIAPSVQALVDQWETPPPLGQVPNPPPAPVAETQSPKPPAPVSATAPRRDAPQAPALTGLPEPAPHTDTRLPAQHMTLGAPPPQVSAPQVLAALPQTAPNPAQPPRPARPQPPGLTANTPDGAPRAAAPPPPEPNARPAQSLRPVARPDRPTAKPNQSSAGRAAQAARGTPSQTPTPGASTKPAAGGAAQAAETRAQAQWGAEIRTRVARAQRYPSGTRATGTVKLRITLARNGALKGAKIVTSSGDPVLDRAALRAVQQARLPAAPKALTRDSYSFNLPLRFAR